MGLITQVEAIALDREIELDEAQEVFKTIQAEQGAEIERMLPTPQTVDEENEEEESEDLNG